uniref:TIL domain-containing protein n=1 Tax=Anopheles farauti TaxID=69004 RepID=A0A182QPX2_9DIPT
MLRNVAVLVFVLSALLCVCAQSETKAPPTPTSCKKPSEVFNKCGSPCEEEKCKTLKPKDGCKKECIPGCYCAKGYQRNTNKVCVPQYMCSYRNYIG